MAEARDSNGDLLDQAKVERATMLLVDLHPLLAYDGARWIVEHANDLMLAAITATKADA